MLIANGIKASPICLIKLYPINFSENIALIINIIYDVITNDHIIALKPYLTLNSINAIPRTRFQSCRLKYNLPFPSDLITFVLTVLIGYIIPTKHNILNKSTDSIHFSVNNIVINGSATSINKKYNGITSKDNALTYFLTAKDNAILSSCNLAYIGKDAWLTADEIPSVGISSNRLACV